MMTNQTKSLTLSDDLRDLAEEFADRGRHKAHETLLHAAAQLERLLSDAAPLSDERIEWLASHHADYDCRNDCYTFNAEGHHSVKAFARALLQAQRAPTDELPPLPEFPVAYFEKGALGSFLAYSKNPNAESTALYTADQMRDYARAAQRAQPAPDLLEKIEAILEGIDMQQVNDERGWWETSTGVEFGEKCLAAIRALFAQPAPEGAKGE